MLGMVMRNGDGVLDGDASHGDEIYGYEYV